MSDSPTTDSDLVTTGSTEPSAPPDINPDVVAPTPNPEPAEEDTAPSPLTLDDRVAALEVHAFGYSKEPADAPADEPADEPA